MYSSQAIPLHMMSCEFYDLGFPRRHGSYSFLLEDILAGNIHGLHGPNNFHEFHVKYTKILTMITYVAKVFTMKSIIQPKVSSACWNKTNVYDISLGKEAYAILYY